MALLRWIAVAAAMIGGQAGPGLAVSRPTGILRVRVYGSGGPSRQADHPIALSGVAVRVSRDAGPQVEQGRTGSTGKVRMRLAQGVYSIVGYLTPPAVSPERRCESRRVHLQRGRLTEVTIYCPIK